MLPMGKAVKNCLLSINIGPSSLYNCPFFFIVGYLQNKEALQVTGKE